MKMKILNNKKSYPKIKKKKIIKLNTENFSLNSYIHTQL
jgi:hypothetical protein